MRTRTTILLLALVALFALPAEGVRQTSNTCTFSLFGLAGVSQKFFAANFESTDGPEALEAKAREVEVLIRQKVLEETERLEMFPGLLHKAIERTVSLTMTLYRNAAGIGNAFDPRKDIYIELSSTEDLILVIVYDKSPQANTEQPLLAALDGDRAIDHEFAYRRGNLISVTIPWSYPLPLGGGTRPDLNGMWIGGLRGASVPPPTRTTEQEN
ncbi:hypothetical protein K2X33_02655 [bacterium]|nr:hypothetical protein [bacterium]